MKISIITATWNCAATVADCLASVAAQSYAHREHVVIDGASTDGTVAVLEAHRDRQAVLVSEPDSGIYDALNKGIARATGEVVGFLHADDVYAGPEVLAHVAVAFADPAVAAVYGDLQYVRQDNPNQVVRHWRSTPFSPRRLAWGWMPPHPTLYVRREWYARIGGFDTRYRIAADYDCILRLFSRPGFAAVYLPRCWCACAWAGRATGPWPTSSANRGKTWTPCAAPAWARWAAGARWRGRIWANSVSFTDRAGDRAGWVGIDEHE